MRAPQVQPQGTADSQNVIARALQDVRFQRVTLEAATRGGQRDHRAGEVAPDARPATRRTAAGDPARATA